MIESLDNYARITMRAEDEDMGNGWSRHPCLSGKQLCPSGLMLLAFFRIPRNHDPQHLDCIIVDFIT